VAYRGEKLSEARSSFSKIFTIDPPAPLGKSRFSSEAAYWNAAVFRSHREGVRALYLLQLDDVAMTLGLRAADHVSVLSGELPTR
jgi:hypothetical protein